MISRCNYPVSSLYGQKDYPTPRIAGSISAGVTINQTLFWSAIAFGVGVLFGPTIIASSARGRQMLEKKARGG